MSMNASHTIEATRGGDRGATLVEYALIVALIMVVSLGAVSSLQERGEDKLDESDERISEQVDNQYYNPGGTVPPVPTSSTSSIPVTPVHLQSPPAVVVEDDIINNNKWRATVTFVILDDTNTPVIGATLTGIFEGPPDEGVTCSTTDSTGRCTVIFNNINDNKPTTTLNVTQITGGSFQWTPAPGEGSVPISCTPPLDGSCD